MATVESEQRHVLTLLWRIRNMELADKVNMTGIGTPVYRARTLDEKQFKLILKPKGLSGDDKNINLELVLWDDELLDFSIDCEWSFIGSEGSPIVRGTRKNHFMTMNNSLVIYDCPTYEDVFVTRKSIFFSHDSLNIQLRIWKSNGNLSTDELISCRSDVRAMNHSFLWAIPQFSALHLNQKVTAPVRFNCTDVFDDFLLTVSLEGESLKNASVKVELHYNSISSLFVKIFKISALDSKQKVISSTEIKHESFSPYRKETWMLPELASREEIVRKKSFSKNDVLNLRCEWFVVCYTDYIDFFYHGFSKLHMHNTEDLMLLDPPSEQSVEQQNISLQRKSNLICLGEDFLSLYKKQTMTDFELLCDDVSFPVHKNILSARSPVFKAMFSSGMKESDTNSQVVPDLDVHTFNRMLTFLYGGTVEPDLHLESVSKLYYAADKYQVESLKQHCSSVMRCDISVSNVSDILTLADRHQDDQLKLFVHDFFLEKFNEIIKSEEWETFQHREPALAGSTVLQICRKDLTHKQLREQNPRSVWGFCLVNLIKKHRKQISRFLNHIFLTVSSSFIHCDFYSIM